MVKQGMPQMTEFSNDHDANGYYQELPTEEKSQVDKNEKPRNSLRNKWHRLLKAELRDVKNYRFWRAALTEFYASVWLVVFLLGAGCHRADQELPSRVFTALTIAFTVNMMVLTTFSLSGAQVNPAITTMLTVTGRNSISRGVVFFLVQCVGGACAVLILRSLLPGSMTEGLKVLKPAEDVTTLQAFFIEVFLGIIIGIATLSMLEKKRTDFWGSFPHGFGIMMASNYLFTSAVTPVCMNPTFSVGPMVVLGDAEYQWIYIFGPITGLIVGGVTFDVFFSEDIADKWDAKFFKSTTDSRNINSDQTNDRSRLEGNIMLQENAVLISKESKENS